MDSRSPSSLTTVGKHAPPDHLRLRFTKLAAVAVAFSLAVLGVLLVLRPADSSRAATQAVTISSDSRPAARSSVPGVERLVVYGHSMPKGGGASDVSLGYPVLAADSLGLTLVNRAVGGSGAANATKVMTAARPATGRDAVVLHTGMNDVFRRGDAAVGRGRQAIRSFLAGTADAAQRVIILECQPGSWNYTPQGENLQTAYEAWNAMLREEAEAARGVAVLDTCETWDTREFTNVRRYHPNDAGHARMAEALAALLSRS